MPSPKKLKDIILWFLIFLLPTQLGIHFWPDFSFAAGFRIDYLSPTIYLTDILIFFYIIFSVSKEGLTLKKAKLKIKSLPTLLAGSDLIGILSFLLFILLNTLFSASIPLSLVSWSRIIFYLVFFLSLKQEKNLLKKIQTPFLFSTILIISMEVAQLIRQESLNGIFYYLGERQFNLSTPNIAKINLPSESEGFQLLRPYATFSHPNSLAGFLLLSLLLIKKSHLRGVILLGILLTFSKAAILALLAVIIYQKLQPKTKTFFFKTILVFSFVISIIPILPFRSFSVGGFNPSSSILSRLYLGPPTLAIIKDNFLFGTGLNNFIPALSEQLSPSHIFAHTLQPIHSIPLLIFSELGLVGLIILISLLRGVRMHPSDGVIFLIVLAITSSVDHYWWTLHQNHLILALILAIIFSKNTKHEI